MLKKTTLAILGIGFSGVVAAGTMGPVCTPDNVTVPCEARMWNIGAQALYLRPVYTAHKGYGRSGQFGEQYREIDNEWGWGYRLEGSAHFSTGNDVTATWIHYDVDSFHNPFRGTFPLVTPNGTRIFPANYTFALTNKFDQVNMVMGQHVDIGQQKNARFYGGLQYANIRADGTLAYTVTPQVQVATGGVAGVRNTDFNGVGPVIGIDYAYDITQSFSITANTASSILYGSSRFVDTTFYGNGLVVLSQYASKKAIVPSLEAKLGINFGKPFAQGMLNAQIGYMVLNYFNALQNFSVNSGTFITNSDFGLYGPYIGFKWVGNA